MIKYPFYPFTLDATQIEGYNRFSIILHFFFRCELSQKFLPIYEKLAEQFNTRNGLKLANVNCDANIVLCTSKNIEGTFNLLLL